MSKKKKFYLISSILITVIAASFGIFLVVNKHNTPFGLPLVSNEPLLPFGQITREERINHVDWTYANGKQYEQFSLTDAGERKYVVTFYQPNFRDSNIPEKERYGGVLVFEISNGNPKLIWESTENVTLTRPTVDVRDITGDRNAEIIANWSDGKTSILYIYSWNGSDFKLITPLRKVEGLIGGSGNLYSPVFGASSGGDIQVRDIDGDSIDEVILTGPSVSGGFISNIYKWDGVSYYQWKTEKTQNPPQWDSFNPYFK